MKTSDPRGSQLVVRKSKGERERENEGIVAILSAYFLNGDNHTNDATKYRSRAEKEKVHVKENLCVKGQRIVRREMQEERKEKQQST